MGYAQTLRRRKGRMPQAPARTMGTWKLAYADFLTALVAFFLVMWLVKGVPEEGRANVADYFRTGSEVSSFVGSVPDQNRTPAANVASLLRQSRLLSTHASAISILAVDDTVRIDVMDRSSNPLFATASATFTESGNAIVQDLSDILNHGVWPIGVEGHTDAFTSAALNFDNWDLSTQRAHTARRALIEGGLAPERIVSVTGLADTMPINPGEPHLSANRRVTIVLHVSAEPRIS